MTEIPGHSARLCAVVHGAVQGVGFRFFARREALSLGLYGYARNRSDGTVEVVVEGEHALLETYLERIHRGPAAAEVEWVDTTWSRANGAFTGFQILH